MKYLISGTVTGLISGMFLFIVSAAIERLTELELMKLLLNIDFLTAHEFYFVTEVLFHLITSVIIAVLLKFIFVNFQKFYIPALVFSWMLTSALFYVLDYLSIEEINLYGLQGFNVWMFIHLCYFILIFLLHKKGF